MRNIRKCVKCTIVSVPIAIPIVLSYTLLSVDNSTLLTFFKHFSLFALSCWCFSNFSIKKFPEYTLKINTTTFAILVLPPHLQSVPASACDVRFVWIIIQTKWLLDDIFMTQLLNSSGISRMFHGVPWCPSVVWCVFCTARFYLTNPLIT